MTCPQICPREAASQDDFSPGLVESTETLARGAYDPQHGSFGKANIRLALIQKKALAASELSVWRMSDKAPGIRLGRLKAILRIAGGNQRRLFAVTMAPAGAVREITLSTTGNRALCVVDECICDAAGNKHPAHAHIALCQDLAGKGLTSESVEIVELQQKLRHLFIQQVHYRFPAAA